MATKVTYSGNPEHKRNPGDFALTPPSAPRPDKTRAIWRVFGQNPRLCRSCVAACSTRLISVQRRGEFPQNIWAVTSEGIPFRTLSSTTRRPAPTTDTRCPRLILFATSSSKPGKPMTNFEIAVDQWLACEHGDEIARATLGQLELRSGDRTLTFLEDRLARTNRHYANLSAYDLAIWLASNWWRLRWEPERQGSPWRMAHSLPSHRRRLCLARRDDAQRWRTIDGSGAADRQ